MRSLLAAILFCLVAGSALAQTNTPTSTPTRTPTITRTPIPIIKTATPTPGHPKTPTPTRTPTTAPTALPSAWFTTVAKTFADSGYVVPASNYTVLVDPTGGTTVIKLSASPVAGQIVNIKSTAAGTVTIDRNGKNIDGAASNLTISTSLQSYTFQYDGTGWWVI